MKKKGQLSAGMIFIPIIVAVIILGVIFSFINAQRTTTTITDDQFTVANNTCVEVTSNCITSVTSVENATGSETIGTGNYSLCIATGTTNEYDGIQMVLDDAPIDRYVGETVNVSYVERSCQAITGTTGTLIDYVPVLLAVLLLVAVAVYVK